jgi:glycosyltransferase involved in cell wall biosynthesis
MIRGRDVIYLSSIDWSFHWHGPQEIAVRLGAAGNRVLYVETPGIRAPRLADARRVASRLAAWTRARFQPPAPAAHNVHVLSPLLLPPFGSRLQRKLNRLMLARQVNAAVERLGLRPTLMWTYLASDTVEDLVTAWSGPEIGLVYYCVTDFSLFASHPERLAASEDAILARCQVVFTSCQQLAEHLRRSNGNVHLFPFGVDLGAFAAAGGSTPTPGAPELVGLPRPIIGYVGGLHVALDLELVTAAARARTEWSWVFVGRRVRPLGELAALPNVHLVGQMPHAELHKYVSGFDVGVVPYRRGRLTDTVVPTKINEYLAAGKPVVATDLPNVVQFQDRHGILEVTPAEPDAFVAGIERALATSGDQSLSARRREVAAQADWSTRLEIMSRIVEQALDSSIRAGRTTSHGVETASPNPRRPR